MDCSYLTKQNILVHFSCNLNTHFFVWPYQNKILNCWFLFYSLTRQTGRQAGRQTDRQQSSVLYNLMLMGVFFFSSKKRHLASVYGNCNEYRLTLLSHLHGFHDLEWMILLAESDLFVFIRLDRWYTVLLHRTACSVASFGTFVSRTLPYTAYRCTVVFFFFNNSLSLLFAVAINEWRNANP